MLITTSIMTGCLFFGETRGDWMLTKGRGSDIVRTARKYLGVRYKYGGSSPHGFDCSGLVVYVYKKNGIQLPRSAKDQFRAGRKISRRTIKPGDLMFFRTGSSRYSHVVIYAGKNRFIHAPSSGKTVSYDDLSKPYWKKRYVGAVTFLGGSHERHYSALER